MSQPICARCGHTMFKHEAGECTVVEGLPKGACMCPSFVSRTARNWGVVYCIDGKLEYASGTYPALKEMFDKLKTNWSEVLLVHVEDGTPPEERA